MFIKVQVSLIWKNKQFDIKGSRIRTHNPEDPVHHTNHWTTEDLLDDVEII